MRVLPFIAGALVTVALPAFAGGTDSSPQQISLEDLKAKCAELSSNGQYKPIRATITCNELSSVWVEAKPSSVTLQNTRNIGSTARMKGFSVNHRFFPAQIAPTAGSCATFVKVERKVDNVDVEMNCLEMEQITDLSAFCQAQIKARVEHDPALLVERRTNEVQALCPSGARAH